MENLIKNFKRNKRILFCGESTYLNTGYSTYGREVLTRLHNTGKYEIAELGIYGKPEATAEISKIPWRYYPNLPDVNDQASIDTYNSSPQNQFGAWKFEQICLDFKPDIVFDIRDFWMIEFEERSPFRRLFHWAIMPTTDASPQHQQWLNTYASADAVFNYSEWGMNILKKEGGGKINCLGIAPPSAHAIYSPVQDKSAHKLSMGIEGNVKILGTIMRNQRRKLFPDLFKAFSLFLKRTKRTDVYLYCHTSWPDQGWDIPKLLNEHSLSNRCLFTYICPECNMAFPSFFMGALRQCKHCHSFSAQTCNTINGVSTEQLSQIINCFDIYIQYANSEGFGLPQVEAAACGVPVMSIDYSAMSSVVRKLEGIPLKPKAFYKELETGCMRAVPDNEYTVQKLEEFFNLPESIRLKKGFDARKAFEQHYQWDAAAKKWEEHFDSVEIKPDNESWKSPPRINNPPNGFPTNLDNKAFVDWLIINVLGEPEQLNSYMASRMIRDLHYGFASIGLGGSYYNEDSMIESVPKIMNFGKQQAYDSILEISTNRNHWEQIRCQA